MLKVEKEKKKMISKRVLTKWRKEALLNNLRFENSQSEALTETEQREKEHISRILAMTQELLDFDLIKR